MPSSQFVADAINNALLDSYNHPTQLSNVRWYSLVTPTESGYQSCAALDRENRRCKEYADRPYVCSSYPYGRPCAFCTYGLEMVGRRYAAIEETGIFAHDDQPTIAERREFDPAA